MLAHERAHLRARHDLVLIPFTSLRRTFPRSAVIAQAYRTVALLVEMMADDRALRVRGLFARELATALLRFGTAGAQCPAGALSAAEGELTARVNRLLAPPPPLSPRRPGRGRAVRRRACPDTAAAAGDGLRTSYPERARGDSPASLLPGTVRT